MIRMGLCRPGPRGTRRELGSAIVEREPSGTPPPRNLARVDQPGAAPADSEQPGVWLCDRGRIVRRLDHGSPSIEPASGRPRINVRQRSKATAKGYRVTSCVQQHVRQSVANLPRRSQYVKVIALAKDCSAAGKHAIHCTRESRGNGLHARADVCRARGLDQQVDVIGLDRVVRDPEATAIADLPPARLEFANETRASEARNVGSNLDCDVAGVSACEWSAPGVTDLRNRSALPSGTHSSTAPARR